MHGTSKIIDTFETYHRVNPGFIDKVRVDLRFIDKVCVDHVVRFVGRICLSRIAKFCARDGTEEEGQDRCGVSAVPGPRCQP